ncbi:MAG: hypothetical protein HOI66_15430, partial [Verrucomicrobia bacterium]|nr:hypothetical protein [Verrucomicrobiota bacterium]
MLTLRIRSNPFLPASETDRQAMQCVCAQVGREGRPVSSASWLLLHWSPGDTLRWVLLLFGLLGFGIVPSLEAGTFYVNYSKTVKVEDVLAHPESILHPTVDLDPKLLAAAGHSALGYLSIGEIAPDAPYRDRAIAFGVPRPMRNDIWKSEVVDLGASEWREFVLQDLAPGIIDKGFDGIFLDTMDAVEMLMGRFPDRAPEFREGLIRLVKDLR